MTWRCLNNLASTYLCDKFRKRSTIYSLASCRRDNPGGCTPWYSLYGIIPLNRVWVFTLNRVFTFARVCTKQGLLYKHQWNTRRAFARNMISSHVKYHSCYGYIINRAFHSKKVLIKSVMDWYFISVYIINRTLYTRLEIRKFSSRVEKIFHSFAAITRKIFFNTRREISYLRATM